MKKIHKKILRSQSETLGKIFKQAHQKHSRRFQYDKDAIKQIRETSEIYPVIQSFEIKHHIKSLSINERAEAMRSIYRSKAGEWQREINAIRMKNNGRQDRVNGFFHETKLAFHLWWKNKHNH